MPEPAESPRERESAASRRDPSRFASADDDEQLVLTVNPTTRDIVKIEKVDKAGKREELSDEQCAELAGDDEVEEIEAGLEEAFEAGIAAMLGEDGEDVDDDEEAIQRLLIGRLIAQRPGLRGLRQRFLKRLLLRRLLRRKILRRRFADEESQARSSARKR